MCVDCGAICEKLQPKKRKLLSTPDWISLLILAHHHKKFRHMCVTYCLKTYSTSTANDSSWTFFMNKIFCQNTAPKCVPDSKQTHSGFWHVVLNKHCALPHSSRKCQDAYDAQQTQFGTQCYLPLIIQGFLIWYYNLPISKW